VGRVYSTLTVFLTSPEAANRVIERGLVEGGEVKQTERFVAGCGLVQCFRCCGYGHIAKNCRVEARCGHCCGSHETRSCDQKDQAICSNCTHRSFRENKYKVWSDVCPVRTETRNELDQKLRSTLKLYHQEVVPDRRPLVAVLQPKKRGRPPKATRAPESEADVIEVDIEEEGRRRKCQSTLPFIVRSGGGEGGGV